MQSPREPGADGAGASRVSLGGWDTNAHSDPARPNQLEQPARGHLATRLIPVGYHFDRDRPERIGAFFRLGPDYLAATLNDGQLKVSSLGVLLPPEQTQTIKTLLAFELASRFRRRRQGCRSASR